MKIIFMFVFVSGCAVDNSEELNVSYTIREEKEYKKPIEDGGTGTCPPRFKLVFEDESFKFVELPCSKGHNTNPISDEPGWIK